ncbi:trafficking protein particle complex subunit 2-like protein [Podospora conica]|nr:trafficking protein particle complex subunit 2-like protein [Schizothecium conicum]
MATAIPSIACLGVIGRNNNPLHTSIFPSYDPSTSSLAPVRTPLQFSLLLSSTLDVFELRARRVGLTGDYGLLHAVDERLASYGFETNTGVKFVVVVDMRGRRGTGPAVGLREGEMRTVFKAMQTAYVRLLQDPFFEPDEHSPVAGAGGGRRIVSRRFAEDMRRIGEGWMPGVAAL